MGERHPHRAAGEPLTLNGIPLSPFSVEQALTWILERVAHPGSLSIVTTVNLQFLRLARFDARFLDMLRHEAALNLVDGWPVEWLLRRAGNSRVSRAPGSDLTRALLESPAAGMFGIYLLGDAPSTLDAVLRRGAASGWGDGVKGVCSPPREAVDDDRRSEELVHRINASGAKILLVAFGAPRQERWLSRWSSSLQARVGIGIGGSLKFIASPRRRAPKWMRRSGLEWLHRFVVEPKRLGPRYARDGLELVRLLAAQRRGDGASRISWREIG